MKILYLCDVTSSTGYAVAGISTILALDAAGVDVVVRTINLATQYVEPPARVKELMAKPLSDITHVIQHTLPEYFAYQGGVKNIGFFHWETDNLEPSGWQYKLNLMDEVWVCDPNNKKAAELSGVFKPIQIVPIGCVPATYQQTYEKLFKISPNIVYFYHIGDYSERKNVKNLIKCYLEEFTSSDNVCLVLKTYVEGLNNEESKNFILNEIQNLKISLRKGHFGNYPRIQLITDYLPTEIMNALHYTCDCFVSLERAAAWNLPAFDAKAFGNMVIVNGWGGQSQFLGPSEMVDYKAVAVNGMNRCPYQNIYTAYEQWAEPDYENFKQKMRERSERMVDIKRIFKPNQGFIDKWSINTVGPQLAKLL